MGRGVLGRHARRQAIQVGGRQPDDFEQQRLEHGMKPGHAADADAAQRVAVIGAIQRDVQGFAAVRLAALPPVLKRHLQRHFHRRGAVVGKEDVPQPGRRDIDQPLGQGDGRRMRAAQQRDVGDVLELCDDRRVELRMAMAVHVAPQAADRVEIFPAVDVDQRRALAALEDQRLVLGHLRERVPDDLAIPLDELLARGPVGIAAGSG